MDANERFQFRDGFSPRRCSGEIAKILSLPRLQDRERLDHTVAQYREKIRCPLAERFENIVRKFPMMSALFGDRETIRATEQFPHLTELDRKQPPEKRTHADVGKVIAVPSDPALPRAVVTEVRMIERLLHEPVEGYGTAAADRLANEDAQRLIAREHTYV